MAFGEVSALSTVGMIQYWPENDKNYLKNIRNESRELCIKVANAHHVQIENMP